MAAGIFSAHKAEILLKLSRAIDKSPKGFIDLPVLDLVNDFNNSSDFVTTSSCSGRICLFESVNKTKVRDKGGRWLLVNHKNTTHDEVLHTLAQEDEFLSQVFLKHEPLILHVLCRDVAAARRLLHVALSCGFRESGMVLGRSKHMVHIRTTSNSLSTPVADESGLLVSESYLRYLVTHVNELFDENTRKIAKLHDALTASGILQPAGAASDASTEIVNRQQGAISKWNIMSLSVRQQCQRWGHTIVAWDVGLSTKTCLVFGGFGKSNGRHGPGKTCRLNNTLCVSLDAGTSSTLCSYVECAGPVPAPRTFHAAATAILCIGDQKTPRQCMVVFGGRGSPAQAFDDINVLALASTCTNNGEWFQPIVQGDKPAARWRATLSCLEEAGAKHRDHHTFLLVGGKGTEHKVFGDAFELSLHWDIAKSAFVATWHQVTIRDTCGEGCLQRFSHSTTVVGTLVAVT